MTFSRKLGTVLHIFRDAESKFHVLCLVGGTFPKKKAKIASASFSRKCYSQILILWMIYNFSFLALSIVTLQAVVVKILLLKSVDKIQIEQSPEHG